MKLSKKSWLFIGIGLFLIAFVGLWMVYSQQSDVKKQLKEELALAQTRLSTIQSEQLANQQSELEQQLEAAMSQSATAREMLSQPMNSIIISDILFRTAEANSVNITALNSSIANSVVLDGVPCRVLPITAKVVGEVDNLVDFITELNTDLSIAAVKTVSMDIPFSAGDRKPSASIQIEIYTYEES